jgi:hypothetical protein
MRIHLSDPAHLEELQTALRDADCVAWPIADDTLVVLHPFATCEEEAMAELSFFVRAWCSYLNVDIHLAA